MYKVWTYVITRKLNSKELEQVAEEGNSFVGSWTAHDKELQAEFEVFRQRIIVVKVNEAVFAASGCSIDKLTRFIGELGKTYGFDPLNRHYVAYKDRDKIGVVHSSEVKSLIRKGELDEDTAVYNTAVSNQKELSEWEQPLKNTWLARTLD